MQEKAFHPIASLAIYPRLY